MIGFSHWPRKAGAAAFAAWMALLVMCLPAEAARPVLPGEPCPEPARSTWTMQESWVWDEVCAGRIANLAEKFGGSTKPIEAAQWPAERTLSSTFLAAILLHDPYRQALTIKGVRIVGARFTEVIDLSNADIGHELWLDESSFEGRIKIGRARAEALIAFDDSLLAGGLDAYSAHLEQSLFVRRATIKNGADMTGIEVDDQLSFSGAQVTGELELASANIGQHLFLDKDAKFEEVNLNGAEIGGDVLMGGGTFSGKLAMEDIRAGSDLFMNEKANFAEIDLTNGDVGAYVDFGSANVTGDLDMGRLHVRGNLNIKDGAHLAYVSLIGARIDGDIVVDASTVTGKMQLEDVAIGSDLFLRSESKLADVTLSGAEIGSYLMIRNADISGFANFETIHIGRNFVIDEGSNFAGAISAVGARIDGDATITGSTFAEPVDFTGAKIGRSLAMARQATFNRAVHLAFAEIGANLDLTEGIFSTLDATGLRVGTEIRLATGAFATDEGTMARWNSPSKLTLRNVSTGALQDLPEAWPAEVDLEGFTYERLGGFEAEPPAPSVPDDSSDAARTQAEPIATDSARADISHRDPKEFIDWLAKQKNYSPQPYAQLAAVLTASGHPEKARSVLFAGKSREWGARAARAGSS